MNVSLTILLVVIPLIAAPIIAMLRNRHLAWGMSVAVAASLLSIAVMVLLDVTTGQTIHYELGGWKAPWGIAYEIDALNALVAVIVTATAVITLLYAPQSVNKEIPEDIQSIFYAAFQLCLLGLIGIALTGDIFNLFVFLEISSLSSYALIALGKDRKALTAAFSYLVLGTIGATFFLIGVGLLFAASGSLNMAHIAERFNEFKELQLVSTSLIFILVGMGLKAAIFPLHSWLPGAYAQAPSVVSIFLAATATKVAIYVVIRCLFDVYPLDYWQEVILPNLFVGIGCVGIVYGSVRALAQVSMKRLLAYSSIAQIGYMIVGIGLLNEAGLTASLLHLFNHALIKATLFMVAGIYFFRANTTVLTSLRGLGRDMPWTLVAMCIAGLSLIGMPGTVGFVSKWYLLQGALDAGKWYVVVAILVGSLLAILYVWKMVEALYFASRNKTRIEGVETGTEAIAKTPTSMAITTWIMALACIYFGFNTDLQLDAAAMAVSQLLMGTGG